MIRYGYKFDKWYKNKNCTSDSVFTFGGELEANTTIYANWTPNKNAPYTIIFWTQNLDRTGYEVKNSYVVDNGMVGQNIPYETVDNGDEDYARHAATFGNGTLSTNVNAQTYNEVLGHYRGFCLTEGSKNQSVTITPEGDAVLNLYYDRIEYNFKFYLYRDGTQNNRYDYANNSGSGSSLNDLVTWHSNQTAHPSVNGYTIQSETVNGRTYYYFVLQAFYGEEISSKWPTYDKITGANNREAVSYVMMVGTRLKPNPTNTGSGTVKGIITVMNENILGATNNANGNYVVIRFPDSYNDWRYHIWFEAATGVTYPVTRVYNGRTYYAADTLVVRSSNTTDANQNEPKYQGFDYVTRLGQNNQGTFTGGHWTTTENGTTLYHLNYIYNRQQYRISYFDGNYVDGNGNQIQNRSDQLLHKSALIGHGLRISDADKNYIPELPTTEEGYIFEGWYVDKGCTAPYLWSTMPVGGIQVYAKWRQVQYRVFLHPNAENDPTLDWGSNSQEMNFRVSYNATISVPTGLRTDYKFVGWYTNPACTRVFTSSTHFNNSYLYYSTYNKKTDYTDPMNKWGVISGDTIFCSDTLVDYNNSGVWKGNDRPWITKKVDLYGKWRKVVEGANGIGIEYLCGDAATTCHQDDKLYLDNTSAIAESAPTIPVDTTFVFSYWDLQRYDNTLHEYVSSGITVFPGGDYTVLIDNAKFEIIENDPSIDADNDTLYTIRLVAVYESKESHTPTFIIWYKNYGDGDTVRVDGKAEGFDPDNHAELHINEAVSIPVPTRDGYLFKGWYKRRWLESETVNPFISASSPNFLYFNNEDSLFYTNAAYSSDSVASYVGADEANPYDYLYAIWEPIKYYVRFNPNGGEGSMDDQLFYYDEAQNLTPNAFHYDCHDFTGWSRTENGTKVYDDQEEVLNLSHTNDSIVNVYAVWEEQHPVLTLTPDSATCLNKGGIGIKVTDGQPNYIYEITGDTAWTANLADDTVYVSKLKAGSYHVKVTTGTGCILEMDTTISINPVEIPIVSPVLDKVCSDATFEIRPSSNQEVSYLWSDPDVQGGTAVVSPTENMTNPQPSLNGEITNTGTTLVHVLYTVYPIYGSCTQSSIIVDLEVGVASYPAYKMKLTPAPSTLCGGESFEVVDTVNSAIYANDYVLNWILNGDTIYKQPVTAGDSISSYTLTMPDTCEGSFPLTVMYYNIDSICRASSGWNFQVGVKDWSLPANGDSTIACVTDTVAPTTITPSVMPEVNDGCNRPIDPEYYGREVDLNGCTGTVTYIYKYKDCSASSEEKYWNFVYTINDTVKPVISTTAESGNKGCNPNITTPTFTVYDNCEGQFTLSTDNITVGKIETVSPCERSQTWTANYTDCSGNVAVPVSINYTWKQTTAPAITAVNGLADRDLGCNPSAIPVMTVDSFSVSDNCNTAAEVNLESSESDDGCTYTKVWTATYENLCGQKADTVRVTYLWKQTTAPAITAVNGLADRDLGCNPSAIPVMTVDSFSVSDNCNSAAEVNLESSESDDGCTYTKVWTATYENLCGQKADTVRVTYLWKQTTAPAITAVNGLADRDLGCNPSAIPAMTVDSFSVSDNCNTAAEVNLESSESDDGCTFTKVWTATYENLCGQKADTVRVTYTWGIPTTGTDALTVCGSFKLNDSTYTESTVIVYTLANQNACGCDSIVTLTLTVNPSYTGLTDSHTMCQGETFTWQGHTFGATAGTFTETENVHTALGCDSVVTMTVTVNPSYTGLTDNHTMCQGETFTWQGHTFGATAGTFTETENVHTALGCDSVVTMTVTVNPSYTGLTDNHTMCQGETFTWQGHTFGATAGTFTETENVHTALGCDSVVTMTVTVNPSYDENETETICANELPWTWRDTTFQTGTTSADYVFRRTTING